MKRFIIIAALLAGACRDGGTPFTPIVLPADSSSSGRLTYNQNGDHTPAWRASDSVYFTAWSYPSLPDTKGILLALPRTGGIVTPILPTLQVGVARQPWLSAPAFSADGSSIAFFEMTDVRDHEFDRIDCPFPHDASGFPITKDTLGTNSFLQGALLRVRKLNSTSPGDDAQLAVTFPGRTMTGVGRITNVAYPFQRLFEAEGVPIFRPSWSPDGSKVVFSDGAFVRVWTVGQPTSTVVAGTDDGILPAWSPDGSWIAFSKPFKGDTQTVTCEAYLSTYVLPVAVFTRTIYTPLTRESAQLFIVHADGTGLKSLGVGEAPAWTTDSKTVVAHRDQNLYRIDIATGAATLVAGTSNAFEPALSRDNRYLSFARRTEVGNSELNSKGQYNIWVAPF